MNAVIIEDEVPAADHLKKVLSEVAPDIDVIQVLTSFREALVWLTENPHPDLIFMDIELGDGLSLDLIKRIKIDCPIIFVTAYDEYWQEAFELNGIDYLLKPLRKERLKATLQKLNEFKEYFLSRMQELLEYQESGKKFKNRFLVKRGSRYITVKTKEIAFFYAAQKLTFLVDKDATKFILDQSLSDIQTLLNPDLFFRVNRKYLISKTAISTIRALPKSKLSLTITPPIAEEIIISSENSAEFKKWMNQ